MSPPGPERYKDLDIQYYKQGIEDTDLASSCPKLKGPSNWRDWESTFITALGSNNRYYVGMALYGVSYPIPPLYEETGNDHIHQLLIEEGVTDIDTAAIRARGREIVEDNKRLMEIYQDSISKWDLCNNKVLLQLRKTLDVGPTSLITDMNDAHDAFVKLRNNYCTTSYQECYARYTKFCDLRYKGGSAHDFVRRFQDTLRDFNQIAGPSQKISALIELCQFKRALMENPRCVSFIQNLVINDKDKNFMERVYVQFTEERDRLS